MTLTTAQLGSLMDSRQRFTFSPREVAAFRNEKQGSSHDKPWGLWYACGDVWFSWLWREYRQWLVHPNYLYQVVPTDAVLQLQTEAEVIAFNARYPHPHYNSLVAWGDVARDFPGIEFCPYFPELVPVRSEKPLAWYGSLSVASGCIWNEQGLDYLRLVAQRVGENAWEEM